VVVVNLRAVPIGAALSLGSKCKFVEYKEGETDACIRFETPEEVLIPIP
jgi:hypothetical protein